jgi:hypothetical protein
LTTVASEFRPLPELTVERLGYGAGTTDPPIPNLLRVFIGEASSGAVAASPQWSGLRETHREDHQHYISHNTSKGAKEEFHGQDSKD